MTAQTLDDWLAAQLAGHPREVELGLDRVTAVAGRMSLERAAVPTLVVGGTNGKGSVVALASGLIGPRARVGSYTSPHLWRYNERIAVDGIACDDAEIVEAFEAVAAARDATPLTFFEWGTLAALWIFERRAVDVRILEVGLGGRLDAVNIVNADVSVVTSIGLDHTDWLGDTRDAIGFEKAGIYRGGRPALCADRSPPRPLVAHARRIGALWQAIGDDFDVVAERANEWRYRDSEYSLVMPALSGVHRANLAAAIAAVRALGFSINHAAIVRAAVAQRALPGRRETIDGAIPILYDVGHNDDAVALLVEELLQFPVIGRTHVVIGMLSDKPVEAVGRRLAAMADAWYPAGLAAAGARGLSGCVLARRLGLDSEVYDDPGVALAAARAAACSGDRIVVCGSFFTVAQARSPEE